MGACTRFDLTDALAAWRRALQRSGTISSDQVDELEGHLLDVMNTLKVSGISTEEAFLVARHRVGDVRTLRREYEKNSAWLAFVAGVQRFIIVVGAAYLAARAAFLLYIVPSRNLVAEDVLRWHLAVDWAIIGITILLIVGPLALGLIELADRWTAGHRGVAAPERLAGRADAVLQRSGIERFFLCSRRWMLPALMIAFVLPGMVQHGVHSIHPDGEIFHFGIARVLLAMAVLFLLLTDLPYALYRRAYRRAAAYLLFVPWVLAVAMALADSDLLNPVSVLLGISYPCLVTLLLYRQQQTGGDQPPAWAIA